MRPKYIEIGWDENGSGGLNSGLVLSSSGLVLSSSGLVLSSSGLYSGTLLYKKDTCKGKVLNLIRILLYISSMLILVDI